MGHFSRCQPEHDGEHITTSPLGNPPAPHPSQWGKNSKTQRNSEIGFWGFIQNNTGGGCRLVSLCLGHLGQQGPMPSATRTEVHSHHRNCTATGSVAVTAAGPGRGLPGGGGPCLPPRPQLSPAPPGTLIITRRQKEYVYLG